jgi:hypothetical protein
MFSRLAHKLKRTHFFDFFAFFGFMALTPLSRPHPCKINHIINEHPLNVAAAICDALQNALDEFSTPTLT